MKIRLTVSGLEYASDEGLHTATAEVVVKRGRSVETDFISVLGALEHQKYVVNQLLDNVNINASEQEY